MYVDSTGNESDWGDLPVSKSLRQHIEPLLIKYKVNLCLWGHHHSYQRTCPIYKEVILIFLKKKRIKSYKKGMSTRKCTSTCYYRNGRI